MNRDENMTILKTWFRHDAFLFFKLYFLLCVWCHLCFDLPTESFLFIGLFELNFSDFEKGLKLKSIFGDSVTGLYFNHQILKESSNIMMLWWCAEQFDLNLSCKFQHYPTSFRWDIENIKWKNVIPSRTDRSNYLETHNLYNNFKTIKTKYSLCIGILLEQNLIIIIFNALCFI
jgi:hypothetical protein